MTHLINSIMDVNSSKRDALRNRILNDITTQDGKRCLKTMSQYSITLPDFSESPIGLKQAVMGKLVDQQVKEDLESCQMLNWCRNVKPLHPFSTRSNGNCLLNAVSMAMWGMDDGTLFLRRLLFACLLMDDSDTYKRRWRMEFEQLNSNAPEVQLDTMDWEREWETIVHQCDNKPNPDPAALQYKSLEEIHIFALANILKRTIIVIANDVMESLNGTVLQRNHCGGIYLPLNWSPEECVRSPIVLAYHMNHFLPLIGKCADSDEVSTHRAAPVIPLIDAYSVPLMVHFTLPSEQYQIHENLKQYLYVCEIVKTTRNDVKPIIAAKISPKLLPSELNIMEEYFGECSRRYQDNYAPANRVEPALYDILPHGVPYLPPWASNVAPIYELARSERVTNVVPIPPDITGPPIPPRTSGGQPESFAEFGGIKCVTKGCYMTADERTNFLCSSCFVLQRRSAGVFVPPVLTSPPDRSTTNPPNQHVLATSNQAYGLNKLTLPSDDLLPSTHPSAPHLVNQATQLPSIDLMELRRLANISPRLLLNHATVEPVEMRRASNNSPHLLVNQVTVEPVEMRSANNSPRLRFPDHQEPNTKRKPSSAESTCISPSCKNVKSQGEFCETCFRKHLNRHSKGLIQEVNRNGDAFDVIKKRTHGDSVVRTENTELDLDLNIKLLRNEDSKIGPAPSPCTTDQCIVTGCNKQGVDKFDDKCADCYILSAEPSDYYKSKDESKCLLVGPMEVFKSDDLPLLVSSMEKMSRTAHSLQENKSESYVPMEFAKELRYSGAHKQDTHQLAEAEVNSQSLSYACVHCSKRVSQTETMGYCLTCYQDKCTNITGDLRELELASHDMSNTDLKLSIQESIAGDDERSFERVELCRVDDCTSIAHDNIIGLCRVHLIQEQSIPVMSQVNVAETNTLEQNILSGEPGAKASPVQIVNKVSPIIDNQRDMNIYTEWPATHTPQSQNTPVIPHNAPVISHNPPVISHNVPVISHNAPVISHNAPVISHNPPVIPHNPPVISQNPHRVTSPPHSPATQRSVRRTVRKCVSPYCKNYVKQPNHLCDTCTWVLSNSQNNADDPQVTQMACKTSGCQYSGSAEYGGYCSVCFKHSTIRDARRHRVLDHPKLPHTDLQTSKLNNDVDVNRRATYHPASKIDTVFPPAPMVGPKCLTTACGRYGDDNMNGLCTRCFQARYVDQTPFLLNNPHLPGAIDLGKVAQLSPNLHRHHNKSPTHTGVPAAVTHTGVPTSVSAKPKLDVPLLRLHRDKPDMCVGFGCTNYGNTQCRGYCNVCFNKMQEDVPN